MADIGLLNTVKNASIVNAMAYSHQINTREKVELAPELDTTFMIAEYAVIPAMRQNVDIGMLPASKDFSSGSAVKQYWG